MKNIVIALSLFSFFACTPNSKTIDSPHPFHPEWSKNANIYEVNIRQYTPEGSFKSFQTHLPRLKKMGVDILWLMPIQPIGVIKRKGILGSYYSISDYTAINPEFGTEQDFTNLVLEAHELGFKVILDWVPNHTAWDHPWIEEHPDYYYRNESSGEISNGRDDHNNPTDWTDVAELDYENPAMQEDMRQEMFWWINNFHINGFRCDMAGGQTLEFWEETNNLMRSDNKDIFMLAESEDSKLHNATFDMTYGWEFHHLLNKVAGNGGSVNLLDEYLENQRKTFPADGYKMYFIDNHDENSWNGTIQSRIGPNAHSAFILCCTFSQGMPLIYSGQEAGLSKSLRFFSRDTISWENTSEIEFYSKALDLKKSQKSLANGGFGGIQNRIITNNNSVYAFSREKEDNNVVVFLNFSDKNEEIYYQNAPRGKYINSFNGEEMIIKKSGQIILEPNSYIVLIKNS
tara:strand:- start:12690 stop:14063 length:1374 start_codon:yes stop_codon:yes gene_type:complete